MKITLPFTEKFLWDIYNLIEGLGQMEEIFGPRSLKEAICPDIRSLRNEARRKYGRRGFSKTVYYLKKKGLIKTPDWDPKKGIIVTQKGIEKMLDIVMKMEGKKKRHDGKWEMVVFDIPEKKRGHRDDLRLHLKKLGYKQLQQSVWISPYDVLNETQHFVKRYDLEDNVKIFIIEKP